MHLGPLSVSLSVRDLGESLVFYRSLGFRVVDDHRDEHWVVLSNGSARVGLFQGMFPRHVLAFRPGSLRGAIAHLKRHGVDVPDDVGGRHLLLHDPDGNPVLLQEQDYQAPADRA